MEVSLKYAVVERERRFLLRSMLGGVGPAEIDDGDRGSGTVPTWLEVIADVSADEAWTGVALAHSHGGQS